MNPTNHPSGAVPCAASVSSELSQWLYLHTCLGQGYLSPVPYTPVWVVSSGVPSELTYRVRAAENTFHAAHEQSIAADRARLELLEEQHQTRKGPGYNGSPQARSTTAEIKDLKAQLARPVFVNYRDWHADRSTFLELLSLSKFRAMSFVDEMGIRGHGYVTSKFLAAKNVTTDVALLSLIGDQSSDSALIRSSATGGANMLSVRGAASPRFNMMTLTSPQAVGALSKRLKSVAPCKGIVLMLPDTPGETLEVHDGQIAKVIDKVYATADPAHRIAIELSAGWADFLRADLAHYPVSGLAGLAAVGNSLASLRTLVHSVTRAIITRRIFLEESTLPESDTAERTVPLTEEDLQLAKMWVSALLERVFGLRHLSVRADNAVKAREAKAAGLSPKRLVEARQQLIAMTQADPQGFISRTTALRSGVTARVLDALLETYPDTFATMAGAKRPEANKPIKQAIILVAGWERDNPPASPSGPVGGVPDVHPGSELDADTVDRLYRQLQAEAHANLRAGGTPSIWPDEHPPALRDAIKAVRRRHWQTTTLLPSGPVKDAYASLELWFRYAPGGHDMCVWKESFTKWKLDQKWADKDEAAAEDRRASEAFPPSA